MATTSNDEVRVLQVCRVPPSPDSPESSTEFSLPLTYFDTFWFKFSPVKRMFFYQITNCTPTFFNSVILPRLTRSLSLTLARFLPLAGSVTWPPHAAKPIILYQPNDGVSLTVAQSSNPNSFHRLSGNKPREASESHPYIPELTASNSAAAVISLQITFFPDQGFSIGISSQHTVLDGRSAAMFMKSWAHISKQLEDGNSRISLPEELTPLLERTVVKDTEGLDLTYLSYRLKVNWPVVNLSLLDLVRATFEFGREDIRKLRDMVLSKLGNKNDIHLSTFVLVFAYTSVCMVKAKGVEDSMKFFLIYTADCTRSDSPIPKNYFGNCVSADAVLFEEARAMKGENGVVFVAERLSQSVKLFREGSFVEYANANLNKLLDLALDGAEQIGVAGSARLEVYATDFGSGKPRKVEVTSIDGTGAISMAESWDGSGGVEIGLVLKKHEMEVFESLFVNGLKHL